MSEQTKITLGSIALSGTYLQAHSGFLVDVRITSVLTDTERRLYMTPGEFDSLQAVAAVVEAARTLRRETPVKDADDAAERYFHWSTVALIRAIDALDGKNKEER